MTPEQLNSIKKRAAKATPGPWGWTYEGVDNVVITQRGTNEIIARLDDETCDKDLYFIAHARQDIPALVAEVERLNAIIRQFNRQLDGERKGSQRVQKENDRLRAELTDIIAVATEEASSISHDNGYDDIIVISRSALK